QSQPRHRHNQRRAPPSRCSSRRALKSTDSRHSSVALEAGITMRMFYLTVTAGLCAVASCAWAGVNFREGGAAQTIRSPLLSAAVERTHKADRMGGAPNVRGASVPAFS